MSLFVCMYMHVHMLCMLMHKHVHECITMTEYSMFTFFHFTQIYLQGASSFTNSDLKTTFIKIHDNLKILFL